MAMCQRTGCFAATPRNLLAIDPQVRQFQPDHRRERHRAIAGAERTNPPAGREHETPGLDVIGAVVRGPGPAADDIGDVVVTSQPTMSIEVEGLTRRMCVDAPGEAC